MYQSEFRLPNLEILTEALTKTGGSFYPSAPSKSWCERQEEEEEEGQKGQEGGEEREAEREETQEEGL